MSAGDPLYSLHPGLHHQLADQPWHSAVAASGGGAGAVVSAVMLLQPAVGPRYQGNLAPADLEDQQAAEVQEDDLQVGPAQLGEAAFQAGPCSPGLVVAVAAGTGHDWLPFAAVVGDVVS